MEHITEMVEAVTTIKPGEWVVIALIALFLYGAGLKKKLSSAAYFFLFFACLALIWTGEFKAAGIVFLVGAVAIPLGQQLLKRDPRAPEITVTFEKDYSDDDSPRRRNRARQFPPDFSPSNPISKERLLSAINDGEVLTVRYYGEMSDGSPRPIVPRFIEGGKVHARCINSATEKTYFISKMEEAT